MKKLYTKGFGLRFPMQAVLAGFLVVLFAGPSRGQIWNGAINSDWGLAVNWSPASIPGFLDDANFFDGASRHDVDLGNANRVVDKVVIDSLMPYTFLDSTPGNSLSADDFVVVSGTGHQFNVPINLGGGSLSTFNIANGTDLTISGVVSGTAELLKFNNGTLVLTGNNTYSGGTTVSAGILQIGAGGTTGSITGDVTNDGQLVFQRSDVVSFSGQISGAGNLTQAGSGTLTLGSANTFSGMTSIDNGQIALGHANALSGSTVSINVTDGLNVNGLNGNIGGLAGTGDLNLGSTDLSVGANAEDTLYAGTISGDSTSRLLKESAGILTLTGTGSNFGAITADDGQLVLDGADVTLTKSTGTTAFAVSSDVLIAGGSTVTVQSKRVSVNTGSLTIAGAGTQLFTANMSAVFGGEILVESSAEIQMSGAVYIGASQTGSPGTGTLTIESGASVAGTNFSSLAQRADDIGNLTVSGAGSQYSTNTFRMGNGTANVLVDDEATLVVNGSAEFQSSNHNFIINGGAFTTNLLTNSEGVVATVAISDPIAGSALTVGAADGSSTFDGIIVDASGGPGSVTKAGTGTFELTNTANSYSGGTSINGGILSVVGEAALGTGDVSFDGGTLQLNTATTLGKDILVGSGGGTIEAAGFITYDKTLSLGGNSLTFTNGFKLQANHSIATYGTIGGPILGDASSAVTASGGDLTLGSTSSFLGFNFDGTLNAGANTVTLHSAGFANLGILTTISGGTLAVPNGVALGVGDNLQAGGAVIGPISAGFGSTIVATGNLTMGDATKANGFYTNGTISVGANMVTAADANDAVFDSGSLVELGNGSGSAGDLIAANGITLDFGGNIQGHGTVDTPDDPTKPLINNGNITGNSLSDPVEAITITGYIKGVGTLDNVIITGTDAPGFSPATVFRGSVTYSGSLEIEIGGTGEGEFDAIHHSGVGSLGGELEVKLLGDYNPQLGDMFEFLTAIGGVQNIFATELLPSLPGGLGMEIAYETNSVELVVTSNLAGDYNNDGTVDAADYTVWRDNEGAAASTLLNDPNSGVIGAAQYNTWRTNFGATSAALSAGQASIPEPSAFVLAGLGATLFTYIRRGRH